MIVRNCVYPVQNRPNFTFIWVISAYVVLGQPAVPAQYIYIYDTYIYIPTRGQCRSGVGTCTPRGQSGGGVSLFTLSK